jgi:hypothetical protein
MLYFWAQFLFAQCGGTGSPNPITGRGDLQGCEMLRLPHCLDNRLTGGGEVVSLTRRPRSTPQKHLFSSFWYSFLLEAE